MYVIIIQSKGLDYGKIHGTDVQVLHNINSPLDNLADLKSHTGPGKLYLTAPSCTFRGKVIPGLVCCSEGGGISAKILTDCFWYLDSLEIYHCSVAILSCIFDGHHSCFSLEHLK